MSDSIGATKAPITWEDVHQRLELVQAKLREHFLVPTERHDPAWKAELYVEVLLHRIADLAGEALKLHREGSLIAATVLTRSVVESVAMLYWLLQKLRHHAEHDSDLWLETEVAKFLFGSKLEEAEYKMPNVLTGIDHLEREFKGAKRMHNILSEYVHPNGGGVMMAYAEPTPEETGFTLGRRRDPPFASIALESLAIALAVTKYLHAEITIVFKSGDRAV